MLFVLDFHFIFSFQYWGALSEQGHLIWPSHRWRCICNFQKGGQSISSPSFLHSFCSKIYCSSNGFGFDWNILLKYFQFELIEIFPMLSLIFTTHRSFHLTNPSIGYLGFLHPIKFVTSSSSSSLLSSTFQSWFLHTSAVVVEYSLCNVWPEFLTISENCCK